MCLKRYLEVAQRGADGPKPPQACISHKNSKNNFVDFISSQYHSRLHKSELAGEKTKEIGPEAEVGGSTSESHVLLVLKKHVR